MRCEDEGICSQQGRIISERNPHDTQKIEYAVTYLRGGEESKEYRERFDHNVLWEWVSGEDNSFYHFRHPTSCMVSFFPKAGANGPNGPTRPPADKQ